MDYIRQKFMKIHELKINEVTPYNNNPRVNEEAINVVKKSLHEFGFQQPLVIDKNKTIIVGPTRLSAAKELGFETVPCLIADELSEEKIKAYRIMDNKSAEFASWNYGLLTKEVQDLLEADYDLELTGFTDFELKELGIDLDTGFVDEPSVDEDFVPEAPEISKIETGELWLLGHHKLLCGDATSKESCKALLEDKLADLVYTDPPYNVNYGGGRKPGSTPVGARVKAHGPIMNDHMTPKEFDDFLAKSFKNYHDYMKPLSSIYVFHPDAVSEAKITFEREFSKLFKKSATLIWNKGHAGLGYADYRPSHEPILYGWKKGDGKHFWCGDRTKKTVLDISKDPAISYVHPTQKPVALAEELIVNSTRGKDIVLDYFLGSGSTLIAAEKTKRVCYGMELDPKYCDVIINRWQQYSGKDAISKTRDITYNELQKDTKNGK